MSQDPFSWWYSLTTVARRVDKSPLTIRRAMEAGKFGGKPGTPEFPGRRICGQWHFPWPAVARFLGVPPNIDCDEAVAFRARNEGELRRKVAALSVAHESEQEAHNA